ncbi:MAG: lamin tail domain-containing protein, partial [Ignavibacterium sp.]
FPLDNDTVSISVKILNQGLQPANFVIELFEDTNLDSIPDILRETTSIFNLPAGDSSTFQFSYQIINIVNRHGFTTRAVFESDEDTTNNSFYKTIKTGFPPQSIVVNEIMYTPQGGEPEWIELYNNTGSSINLRGWSISDIITTPVQVFIEVDIIISPGNYLILTKDFSILNYHRLIPSIVYELDLPVLNNDTDGIVLKDERGAIIDSVRYLSDWGGTNGYSLERKEATASSNLTLNWDSSIDIEQSTPGRINSITPKQFDLSVASLSFNPRFPVAGDNVFISAFIKNNGSSDANNINVEFYVDTDSNDVVDQLLSREIGLSLASGDTANITSGIAIENLTTKTLTAVRVVFQEDEDTLNNYFEKAVQPGFADKVLVINEVMYSPADGEPEWIELINISDDSVNLMNWSVSDLLSTPTKNFITNQNVYLQPDEFLIIAKDTSFNSFHPDAEAKTMYVNFGTLGNTSDGIIIYDFRDGIIDSLLYSSDWGGGDGFSLERISVDGGTNDITNWTTSLDANGSTPGTPNSIENVQSHERNDLVINEIMFEPDTDNSEYIEFYNPSSSQVNIGGWRIEDENGNREKLSEVSIDILPNDYFVLASDSSFLTRFGLSEDDNYTILGISSLGLVNTGELILLSDVRGNVIDSIWYSDKWHNDKFVSTKNIALERINPLLNGSDASNWSSSVNVLGGTPAKENSIFTDNLNTESNISVSPNPFSPDNDGFEDFTIINYNLTQATSQVRIKIFDSTGRLVRTLANSQASGSSGSIIFNGLADDGEALRIGIYIIFLEAINEGAGVVENLKTVVVVARRL